MSSLFSFSFEIEEWFDETAKEELAGTSQVASKFIRREGLLVDMGAGTIHHVALKTGKELGKNKTIFTILPNSGEKYLITSFPIVAWAS